MQLITFPSLHPKGQLGHLLGAAGAVEAIIGIQALRKGIIPQTINADPVDPEMEILVTSKQSIKLEPSTKDQFILKNSFGFGGHNISIVFSATHKNQ